MFTYAWDSLFLYPGRLFQWAVDLSSFVQDSLSTAFGPALAFFSATLSFLIFLFKVLNQWIMDQVPIGNKAPRPGYARQFWCPACRGFLETPLALSSGHVLLECVAVEGTSQNVFKAFFSKMFFIYSGTLMREGIRTFLDECAAAGRSEKTSHYLFVNGFDAKKAKIPVKEHLKRGAILARLTDAWLSTWGGETET